MLVVVEDLATQHLGGGLSTCSRRPELHGGKEEGHRSGSQHWGSVRRARDRQELDSLFFDGCCAPGQGGPQNLPAVTCSQNDDTVAHLAERFLSWLWFNQDLKPIVPVNEAVLQLPSVLNASFLPTSSEIICWISYF